MTGCCGCCCCCVMPAPPLVRRWFDEGCCAICVLLRCIGVLVAEPLADPAALLGPEDVDAVE